MKPQTSHQFFSPAPGHLFAPSSQSSLKAEAPASAGDTWPFLSTLTVDPQPKASVAPTALTQDFPTVNLSDLHDFPFSSFTARPQDQMSVASGGDCVGGAAVSQDVQNAFGGGPFRVDPSLTEDFPEFPSFSEVQGSDVENINIEEIQALLGQSGLSAEGGLVMGKSASGADAPEQSANPAANGSAWMPLPPSIANYINHENMIDSPQAPPTGSSVLEDLEMISSMDEDRLMSILTSNNQVAFQPGHPT